MGVMGQANIIPVRTDVSGFTTWSDTDVAGTTYIQLLKATSVTITPTMNFDNYTDETLNFKARTFGGTNATENELFVAISIDNGLNWTDLGSRTPASSTLTAVEAFNNVSMATDVWLPCGCCQAISVKNTSTQEISVANANITVNRIG